MTIAKSKSVKKLLASASLATAFVSWIATAQGLNTYVFAEYWQAAIISAAIQGSLFAFSVNAISLFKRLKFLGRIALAVLWICLLLSSSIFSYVYMSKIIYSEELLEEDANRIISQICLERYYELDDILELEREETENDLECYISKLGGSESSTQINENQRASVEILIEDLNRYKEMDIVVPQGIISALESISEGAYIKSEKETLDKELETEIKNAENIITRNNELMQNEQANMDSLNDRLASFANVNNQTYIDLSEGLSAAQKQYQIYSDIISNYDKYKNTLTDCQNLINSIDNSLENQLFIKTIELRKCMNEEELDPEEIQKNAEEVYNILIDNNVSAQDERLVGYREFRNNINDYKRIMEDKNEIKIRIETIYGESNSSGASKIQWREHLQVLQDISKNISADMFLKYSEETENAENRVAKTDIIEQATTLDRLYLSDLNDFELAWTLLTNPIHTYKTLLIFSLIFAFGIDLFSFGTGMLLYFLKEIEKIIDE